MKKTLVILFSLLMVAVSYAQQASQPTMRFYVHDDNHLFNMMGGLQKVIQLQYNYENDKLPIDSIYEGKANKQMLKISETEYISSTPIYAQYQRLMFVCKTDTVTTDLFTYAGQNGIYDVNLHKEGFNVINITPWFFRDDMPAAYWRNLIVNLIVEVLALWLVLLLFKYPQKGRFLVGIALANVVSLTVFHFGIMKLLDSVLGYFIGLTCIVLFESFFLWYFTRKAGTFGRMVVLVVFLNFISLLANGALHFFNGMFGAGMVLKFI